jgi:hypothetical protein
MQLSGGKPHVTSVSNKTVSLATRPEQAPPLPSQDWATRVLLGRKLLARMFRGKAKKAKMASEEGSDGKPAILVAPCSGARSVLITFGGNAGYLILPPAVQQLPHTHIIAIRDPKRCFGLCGVAGLGETYEVCRSNLRRLIVALGGAEIHCLGVSAGGYAALRFGLDIGAQGVLGMSAPTTLDLADDPGATLRRYPYLTALYRERRDMGVDLAKLYAETSPRPRVLLLYAPTHGRDAWLSNRMRGIGGVELEEISEKAGHRVMQMLESTNSLEGYVEHLRKLRRYEGPTPS